VSFLTPAALAGFLLAIPIVLLYMLRLRRRELTISSTFLWAQVVRDHEANTPWQRLRRNLLLLLQLLTLALLVLALARPFITVPAVSAGQIVLLLDASASMNAVDGDGGTRFEEARQRALEIINTMSSGDTLSIIRVTSAPEVLAPFTADRAALTAALQSAQPSRTSADWNAALTLAAAGAAGAADFSAVIISDGGLADAARLPAIPGRLQYVPVGRSDRNLAISGLATGALPGQPTQLFAQITNYGGADAEVVFDLRVDGQLVSAERVTVPANDSLTRTQDLPDDFTTVHAGLTLPAGSADADLLADDNSAYTVSAGVRARRALLMTTGNRFLEQALRSLPDTQSLRGDTARAETTGVLPGTDIDLYVFDGWLPAALPDGDMLILNPPASTEIFTVGAVSSDVLNPRVRRDDPRMAFIDFSTVNLLQFRTVTADWAEALISADGGPLLLAGEHDGRQIAILTFDLRDSDLPLQITWPLLLASLLDWFAPQSLIDAPDGLRVGDSIALHPGADADVVRVTLPDGAQQTLDRAAIFADTAQPGLYRVEALADGAVIESAAFAVNLFDPDESRIRPAGEITLGDTIVTEAAEAEIGQREFWPPLALAAVILLVIEWWVYHRRQRAPARFKPVARGEAR
jgi:hypothetical protein